MNELMALGNGIILVGTLLLIRAVIKNRTILQGYSFIGATLTFTGLFVFGLAFYQLNEPISVALLIPTLLYWFSVVIFKARY
jgi:hypothetical protein